MVGMSKAILRKEEPVKTKLGVPGSTCLLRAVLFAITVQASASAGAQGWKPTQNVEIVIPAGSGGALDKTGRLYQLLLKQAGVTNVTSSVVNKTGGGHSVGYSYLNQHSEDPHYLLITSTSLVTNQIVGTSPLSYRDITPISLLFNEYVVFCVSIDSQIQNAKDLLSALRTRPDTISVGVGSSIAGANSVAAGLIGKAAGTPPKQLRMITFKSSTEGTVQLLGGHISLVATSPGIVLPHVIAGKVRALAIAAPARLAGPLANIPTWKELGMDVVVGNWRILIAPKGLSAEAADYWDRVTGTITASAPWRNDLERISAQPEYMNRKKTAEFLEEENGLYRSTFAELGIRKK